MLATVSGAQEPERTYFEFQVTKPVRQLPGMKAPKYPIELRSVGTTGEVLAQFIVDTLGQPVMTSFKVLRSDHDLFSEAVRDAVAQNTYQPAELNGRKVRQLVQQPFVFAIAGKPAAPHDTTTRSNPALDSARAAMLANLPRTPKPHSGTVDGWWMEQRATVDSGNGGPSVRMMKMYGTAGRLRMESVGASPSPRDMVMIADSGAQHLLGINTSRRTVFATPFGPSGLPTMKTTASLVSRSITEPTDGDLIAGVRTRRYHAKGTMVVRITFGDRTCATERPFITDAWTTDDARAREVEDLMMATVRSWPRTATSLMPARDSMLTLPGARMRTVGRMTYVDKGGAPKTMTMTYEVTGFGRGPLDAALFDPPEGFQLIDASRVMNNARTDSLMREMSARVFTRLADSTALAPGEKRTCTSVSP